MCLHQQSCFHHHFTHASAAVNLGTQGLLAMVYYEILQGNDYKKKPDYNVKKIYTYFYYLFNIIQRCSTRTSFFRVC